MEQSGTHENAASGERFEEDEQKLPSTLGERMAKVFDDMRREGMSTEAIYTQLYSDLRRLAAQEGRICSWNRRHQHGPHNMVAALRKRAGSLDIRRTFRELHGACDGRTC